MQGLDQIIANVLSTLNGVQVVDPKLALLKQIACSYLIETKGACELMISKHIESLNCVDDLELYIKQQFEKQDLTNIYKQAYFYGEL